MNGTYRFEVNLSLKELMVFQLFMLLFRLRLWRLLVIYFIVIVYMIIQVFSGQVSLKETTEPLLYILGIPLLFTGFMAFASKRNYEQEWKPQLPIAYVVDEDGIATTAPNTSSKFQWDGIQEVRTWGGLILLFMSRRVALIIPRRSVGDQAGDFIRYVSKQVCQRAKQTARAAKR